MINQISFNGGGGLRGGRKLRKDNLLSQMRAREYLTGMGVDMPKGCKMTYAQAQDAARAVKDFENNGFPLNKQVILTILSTSVKIRDLMGWETPNRDLKLGGCLTTEQIEEFCRTQLLPIKSELYI